ncbi:prophage L54a N-6-adenine-methyltransferase [Myxococcus stipitatus DSM 14675]|uniref:Prophage L54a N-6-adenine-methyltransferase n=1 Tax=Myxococcus stipitatus (strain DSM 14675 / JCM 12634 / Mx s8) TaxID=1278073 RepID=L7U593_MYXSD|nr:DNA N-6-adenine-methyltransferase [Myxococcus stipitatus]AGC43298.1 prophage L54a N-6-adenine-methyltransferase [Myxococcus stipitatus DSM 14675]
MNPVHFSSASAEWATPRDLFARLHAEHEFTLDVCATEENTVLPRFYTRNDNGLAQDWAGERCWMNPPYGTAKHACKPDCAKKACEKRGQHIPEYVPGIQDWVEKAATCGSLVVALLPARTDTRWWHRHIWDVDRDAPRPGVRVKFFRGRLKFGGRKTGAPFPSALVTFGVQS